MNKFRTNKLASIDKVAGRPVEITWRGDKKFTFSYEVIDNQATCKIMEFFKGLADFEVVQDEECGTFIYCNFNEG